MGLQDREYMHTKSRGKKTTKETLSDISSYFTSKHLFLYGVIVGYLINTFLGIPILTLIAIYMVVRFGIKYKRFVKKVVDIIFKD